MRLVCLTLKPKSFIVVLKIASVWPPCDCLYSLGKPPSSFKWLYDDPTDSVYQGTKLSVTSAKSFLLHPVFTSLFLH